MCRVTRVSPAPVVTGQLIHFQWDKQEAREGYKTLDPVQILTFTTLLALFLLRLTLYFSF